MALKVEKIKTLTEFKSPNNAAELTSFLGLAVCASRWIPDLATKSEPLRKLTRSKEKWYRDSTLKEILDYIKYSIKKSVSYFDLKLKTVVTTDASPVGLSAILTQYDKIVAEARRIIMSTLWLATTPKKSSSVSPIVRNLSKEFSYHATIPNGAGK